MENGSVAYLDKNRVHGDDAYLTRIISPNSVLDGVFDGVSTGNGRRASKLTVEKLEKGENVTPSDIGALLQEANDELYKFTRRVSLTTATLSLKIDDKLYVFNVGDSPAYLIRNGVIKELTTMDKVAGDPLSVTNAVGTGKRFRYHTNPETYLQAGDRLVLVTDGVSDNIDPKEIARIVTNENTPQKAAYELWELLKKMRLSDRGRVFGDYKLDDTTAIIRFT